jgi:leucyl aminopeptidase
MAWNVATRPGRPEGGEAMGLRAVYAAIVELTRRGTAKKS